MRSELDMTVTAGVAKAAGTVIAALMAATKTTKTP